MGPLGPTVMVDVFVSIGHPVPVVRTSGDLNKKRKIVNFFLLVIIWSNISFRLNSRRDFLLIRKRFEIQLTMK